jgi:3-oxoadipate enol-lactonase
VPKAGVGEIELFYERSGAGEPLLLIQGMSGSHRAWGRPFLEALEQSFECIVFDNRGIGGSTIGEEPFTIAELAADTAGLLDALGLERVHVLGISMGGMVAQQLALAHPQRLLSLTLGCTYCGGTGSMLMDPADFQGMAEAMASGDRPRVLRAMWELNLSPAFRAEEERFAGFAAMAEAVAVPQRTVELQLQAIVGHNTRSRLAEVETPTLVIHGDVDRVLPYPNGELIAALMPNAHLQTLADVGHMFWWEQPTRSAELIRAYAPASA